MIVPLIPLFLAANLNFTENAIGVIDDWKYGPEAIYEVRFACEQCIWFERDHPETAESSNTTFQLGCRPKSNSTLSCQFYSEIGSRITSKNWNESLEYDMFELNFDRTGLQKIVVSNRMDPFFLDLIKATVSQLNVAADVFKIRKNHFEISENFFTGTCQTHYLLIAEKIPAHKQHQADEKPWENLLNSELAPSKGQVRKLGRTRNLDKCHKRLDYFFPNMAPLQARPTDFVAKLISSRSLMTIGESDFSSWTENTIVMKNKLNSTEEKLTEIITLTLQDIVPATGPLINFKGPTVSASIFLKALLNEENSGEDSSSVEIESLEDKTNAN